MTKWMKFAMGLTIVLSALAFSPLAVKAEGASQLLRVGLQYGSVKDQSVALNSSGGFTFGLYQSGSFIPLMNLNEYKDLSLIKNGTSENETLITTPNGSSPVVYGKYHIQVGSIQPTYEACLLALEKVRTVSPGAFPAYDGGWRVYIGAYFTEAEYNQNLSQLSPLLTPYELTRAPFNYTAFMVLASNQVKLMFSTSDSDFGFVNATNQGMVSFNKYKYRGGIVVKRYKDSDPTVINFIPVEEYLYGVLPYEISPKWPIESQKAQAVAARNYAMTNLNKHKKYGFDLCNTDDCQVYAGANVEAALSNQAVNDTKGIYLKYAGKLATTYFHSNSGGRTENSENVWSSAVPYLVGVDDPYSVGSPNDVWTLTYTSEQIKAFLAAKKIDIGDVTQVIVESYSINGRALKTTFVGTKGKVSYEKDKLRTLFPAKDFKSIWFTVSVPGAISAMGSSGSTVALTQSTQYVETASGTVSMNVASGVSGITDQQVTTIKLSGNQFTFNGKGWGHGIGLSQWGAKKMAEQGFTYDQILKHYYQNTYLEQ